MILVLKASIWEYILFFNRRILHLILISISCRQAGYLVSATTSLPKILHFKVWRNKCKGNIWRMSLWSCITKVGPFCPLTSSVACWEDRKPQAWTSQMYFSLEISDPGSTSPLYERQTLSQSPTISLGSWQMGSGFPSWVKSDGYNCPSLG